MATDREYVPNEAQLRNLMRYAGVRMADATAALERSGGDWDRAVADLERRSRPAPRRPHRPGAR